MKVHDRLEITATVDNLDTLLDWMDELLMQCNFKGSSKVQLDISVEEIYINICNYAYDEGGGKAFVEFDAACDPLKVIITFEDMGKPYDPLLHEDPDIELPLKDRKIGGLGIFMTKKYMDDVSYEYIDGKNVLKLVKFCNQNEC
jgi:anti-sigma regulatory factor (Ser/Thr protein kinase)